MKKFLNSITIIISTISFIAGVVIFLYALGWNNEYVGHQIGGNMGNIIADLGNSRHWVAIIPILLIAFIYPFVALLKLNFQPFLVVYIGGIGGCIVCLITSFIFADFIPED